MSLALSLQSPVVRVAIVAAGLAVGRTAYAQDLIWTVPQDPNISGYSATWVSDHDGDGVRDLIVTVNDLGASDFWLLSGHDGSQIYESQNLPIPGAIDAGDVDGDGIGDYGYAAQFPQVGEDKFTIYSGADYSKVGGYTPSQAGGGKIAALGDMNSDGHDDYVISMPYHSAGGKVRWISGADGSVLINKHGDTFGDCFGEGLARIGDVDGDAFPDVIVGARCGLADLGYVRLLSGKSGATIRDIVGPTSVGRSSFGTVVDDVGDIDGDGTDDVIVGAPYFSTSAATPNMGLVRIFSGATGATLFETTGSTDENLGQSIAGLGDVNGDGIPDFTTTQLKVAKVWSGRTFQPLYRFEGDIHSNPTIAGHGGDVDGDGIVDLQYTNLEAAAGEPWLSVLAGNDLWLMAEPNYVTDGDTVTVTTLEDDPGLVTIRVIVEIDGVSTFIAIPPYGVFGADRRRIETFDIPGGLGPHHIVQLAFAQRPSGRGLLVSGREVLDLY